MAAAAAVEDVARRVDGSRVAWSRDWDESFGDALMERVTALLGPPQPTRTVRTGE